MAQETTFARNHRARTSSAVALALTSIVTAACSSCRAAERDEGRGLRYTAAMEWRKAAEFAPLPFMAEHYWREWERLMQLPRRLAGPIQLPEVSTAAVYEFAEMRLSA